MRRPCLVVLVRAAAWTCAALALGVAAAAPPVSAQDTVLMLEGEVPSEGDYFLVPFEVPAGIAELEIAHDDLSDFVMISDHNTTAQLDYYAQIQAAHPSLLFIPGVEVTTYKGHAMSLGGTQWIDHRLGFEGRTIVQVAEEVRAQSALFTVNHPALSVGDACIGCAWGSELDGSLIDALEVQTGAYSVTGSIFFGRVITRWENSPRDTTWSRWAAATTTAPAPAPAPSTAPSARPRRWSTPLS